ncbi:hypothetical protein J4E80_006232 [Alternaria sp. BMP 0032]|nr:hypothetical protein J4E80_006232 [Alternaria sp. BMP 0032]
MSNDPKTSDAGRETPLPQYEKTQSVPFTLNLQEDARNPGQFQLVFNLGPKQQSSIGVPLSCAPNAAASTTLRDGLKSSVDSSVPQKTSPPSTPLHDRQGWADLDNVPPDFLKKVVPDWNVSFSRSDSTASTQSKRLTDIKARIKKKGKGYVVRLLKGSTDSNEIAEVDLGQAVGSERVFATPELDSAALPAELYSPPSAVASNTDSLLGRDDIFEIGTSNTSGIQRSPPFTIPPRSHLSRNSLARTSIAEDGFSDAETLIPDIRSIYDHQIESRNDNLDEEFERPAVPTIVEPPIDDHVGEIPLPPEAEIRTASSGGQNTTLRYWGLALSSDPSKYSPSRIVASNPFSVRMPSFVQESWLLTCANEGRLTPKIVHLDVNEGRVRSDKDLALALREHYDQLNRRWFNWARLRGLTTIEFVQFEVHRNRFADIRATPSMPPKSAASSASTSEPEKSAAPPQHPYTFEPNDLLPPVGSTYLLHLFKHPQDYEGELITYLRSPKRRQRLEFGMGWGVHLVEGFLAQRVWAVMMGVCGLGSTVFAILWTVRKGDVQGAFGVAQWVLGIAVLLVGGLQAWLE